MPFTIIADRIDPSLNYSDLQVEKMDVGLETYHEGGQRPENNPYKETTLDRIFGNYVEGSGLKNLLVPGGGIKGYVDLARRLKREERPIIDVFTIRDFLSMGILLGFDAGKFGLIGALGYVLYEVFSKS
ncbi:MAG: hypothetical protein ACE5ES_03420 [Candidatus Nanoarchaeia archaeon]